MKPWEKYQQGAKPWEKYQERPTQATHGLPRLVGTSPKGAPLPLRHVPPIPDVIAPTVRETPMSTTPWEAFKHGTASEAKRMALGAQALGKAAMGQWSSPERARLEKMGLESAERSEQFPVAAFGGQMLPYMATPQALVSTVPRAAATGGVLGAIGSGGEPGAIGLGAAGGAGGAALGKLLTRPFQASEPAERLMAEGVQPTVGQGIRQDILGRSMRRGEEAFQSMPVLGDIITASRQRAIDELSEAAINRAMPFGQKVPRGTPVRDSLNIIRRKSSEGYDKIFKNRDFDMMPEDIRGFQKALGDQRILVDPGKRSDVLEEFTQLLQLGRSGDRSFTGQAVKQAQSEIRGLARQYGKSQTPTDRQLGRLYERLDQQIGKWMRKSLPETERKQLKELDRAFANEIRVERAASYVGADEGQFTPAQLQRSVQSLSGGARKGQFARGGALMQDLSEAGKTVLSGRLGESGTTPRALYNMAALGALGGASILRPETASLFASWPIAKLGATRPVQKWMLGGFPGQQRAMELVTPTFGRAGVGMGQ